MKKKALAALLAVCCLLSGCASGAGDPGQSQPNEDGVPEDTEVFIDAVTMEGADLEGEMIPLASAPAAVPLMLMPEASGKAVVKQNGAEIDYSNVTDGYVMARFPGSNSSVLKARVIGPSGEANKYTYTLPTGSSWSTFPLAEGNGSYTVQVLQNTTGNKYALLASTTFTVTLKDEFAPFLRPNQFVNYENADNTVKKAAELTKGIDDPLDKVGAVYNYVVKNLTYDRNRAAAVTSSQLTSYVPDLDSVLAEKKGICFDYASLMTGMLRSQGIPCKLVFGYAGTAYHAWISVWTEETGWIDNAVYFDGTTWHRMDPTFASSGNGNKDVMEFIGNGKNYTEQKFY